MRTLSERERRFVEAYTGEAAGNATRAAELAGYRKSNAASQGSRLLKKAEICQALQERRSHEPHIATREERRRFWTEVYQNADVPWRDRLKASELLGKSEADFIDRMEHSGKVTIPLFALPGSEVPSATIDE